ncbi:MAG: tyrosine-type recombinase/integrase [Chloroflexi bacterium]|nr:tyrosine-type recombinase/integrase [Chloroflexota bacterium]
MNNAKLADQIDTFIVTRRANGLAPRTVEWYAWTLGQFSKYVNGNTPTRELCRTFIANMQERGLSAYTIRNTVRVLKVFFRWCVAEGLIETNPTDSLKIPKTPKRVPRGILQEDLRGLLAVANERDRAILLVLADCGVRVGELCGMKISELDLPGKTISVIGKGDRERFVFLSPITCKAIEQWVAVRTSNSPYLFVSEQGNRFCPNTVTQILRRLGKRAGIRGRCNPHSFRHAFARDYLMNGGDLASLSLQLGHTDIQTTMIYSMFLTAELREKHARHSPLSNFKLRN